MARPAFRCAVKLHELGIPCLVTTGKAPSFPMPDLALGCGSIRSARTISSARSAPPRTICAAAGRAPAPGRPGNLRLYPRSKRGPRPRPRPCSRRPTAPAPGGPCGPRRPGLARRPARHRVRLTISGSVPPRSKVDLAFEHASGTEPFSQDRVVERRRRSARPARPRPDAEAQGSEPPIMVAQRLPGQRYSGSPPPRYWRRSAPYCRA